MSLSPQDRLIIESCLAAAGEGKLTAEQAQQLALRVKESDEFARLYVQLSHLEAALRWDYSAGTDCLSNAHQPVEAALANASNESVATPAMTFPDVFDKPSENALVSESASVSSPLSAGAPAIGRHAEGWRLFSVFALGAFVAIAAMALFTGRGSDREAVRAKEATVPVAYLTSNTGCSWGNDSLKLQAVGSSVQLGDEIALQEGIAEFRLSNGVYISVEGPAGLVLTSPDSMVLQYGKITTHVPWPVSEFRVLAGACRLSASDAEFGVSVTGGRVDTHVFSGDVIASNELAPEPTRGESDEDQSQARGNKRFTSAVIGQGRALVVVNQNSTLKVARWEKATPSLFATKLTMAGPLPVSQAYCDTVKASHPFGYWRFESGKDRIVPNEMPGAPDLSIVGDLRLSGLSGNRVAEFRPGSDCYLLSHEPLDALAKTEYSSEVWIKPSHTHLGTIFSLCTRDEQTQRDKCAFLLGIESSIHQQVRSSFSIDHPCSIRYLHRDPPDRSRKTGTSCFSKRPYSIRRWQHVVSVKKGELMELYVDGKLAATTSDKTLLASGLHMVVGRQESGGSDIQFIGQLDELAVYPRALGPEEIKAHYQAIDWKDVKKADSDPKDS